MSNALTIFAAAIDAVVCVPAAVVSVEILAALPRPRERGVGSMYRPPVAVLVPAHNERDTIAATVARLLAQLQPGDRLLVVADNCTDNTADLARAAGAEVLERDDLVRRGKGFALDAGRAYLAADPRPVLVIVDADVRLAEGALDRLAETAHRSGRPTQGVYLLRQSEHAHQNPISMLAFQVRNFVRPLGLSRLGGPSPLFGAGMAFPWAVIENAPLASPHLTEDVALALDLACAGHAPVLCPHALIEGDSAPTATASAKQRRRWEHGHLSLITSAAPRTLLSGIRHLRPAAVMLALDVMVPPLSLLVMSAVLTTAATGLAELSGLIAPDAALAPLLVTIGLLCTVLLASIRFSPAGRRGGLVLAMARYALGKLPIYAGFIFNRQRAWERTDRAPTAPPPSRPRKAA